MKIEINPKKKNPREIKAWAVFNHRKTFVMAFPFKDKVKAEVLIEDLNENFGIIGAEYKFCKIKILSK